MKKAIQFCTPLLLILAIGCDDTNQAVSDSTEINTNRADEAGPFGPEPVHADVKRVGQLVKVERLLDLLTDQNIINPFSDDEAMSEILSSCQIIADPELQPADSVCQQIGEWAYTIDILNCDFGNGDLISGVIKVSSEHVENLASPEIASEDQDYLAAISQNNIWTVDMDLVTDTGANITACGEVSNGLFRSKGNYIVHVPDTHGSDIAYEMQTNKGGRGLDTVISNASFQLQPSNATTPQIEHLNIHAVSSPSSGLLPDAGTARTAGPGGKTIYFEQNLSDIGQVYGNRAFRHNNVVDIPAL
jgi:hypothetical protein